MKYCIGIDLGGTNIAAGLVDLDSKSIVRKISIKTRAPRPCEEISKDIADLCIRLCTEEGISADKINWVGVATPGAVKSGVVRSACNLGWKNANLGELISGYSGIQTYVANDANAAAYAEAVWGVGEGADSLVAITIGTGVGGGIVIDGKIWEGINGFAAELGHAVIVAGGRECSCGRIGCLEAYCSASALVRDTKRIMKFYPESKLWDIAGGDVSAVNGKTAFDAKRMGDPAGTLVVDSFIDYLAIGVGNAINIFQPEVVCIGGGISWEGDDFLIPLKKRLRHIALDGGDKSTRVELAKFRNDAGIIGAALLGIQTENKEKV